MTVRQTLNRGADRLRAHDCPDTDPEREAQALLSQVLGLDSTRLAADPNGPVSPEEQADFDRQLTARLNHRPLAYLLGTAPFLDFTLTVTPDTLIPRPATETLAQTMLAELASEPAETLADIGTGAGGLAIAAARSGQAKRIIAVDISEPALAVARQNAARLGLTDRIEFLQGDLLAPAAETFTASAGSPDSPGGRFVVANLPYLPNRAWPDLAPEIREHEPRLALVSGPDGLDHYRRLVEQLAMPAPLTPNRQTSRRLLLEILPEQYLPLSELVQAKLCLAVQPIANESGTTIGLLAKSPTG